MATLLAELGCELSYCHWYKGDTPSALDVVDAVLIMGGPMSVHDEAEHPWLVAEKAYLQGVLEREKPVLGVCLGAQLIADVLGARVFQQQHKEIGWMPIQATALGQSQWGLPAQLPVLHWHGESFELPAGAELLAHSAACANQAFAIGQKILGLQFHLEMDAAAIASISQHCADELRPGPWVQSLDELRQIPQQQIDVAHNSLRTMLQAWLA